MLDIMKMGSILMVYALVSGGALAVVNLKTVPLIVENKRVSENNARAEVLPGMDGGYELKGEGGEFPYWVGYRDAEKKDIGGYIFISRGSGYSSVIESMAGVDEKGTVVAVKILSQQETPGLGSRIEEVLYGESDPWFTRQFTGKTADDNYSVKKDGGTIDSITGATISSRTVSNSIQSEHKKLMEIVGEGL